MIKLLFTTLLFITSLYANKVIYLSYSEAPQRVIKGEIFPITLKALSTVKDFEDIIYDFSNHSGLKLLTSEPQREYKGKYFYDTFFFMSTQKWAKLPDVTASLVASLEYDSSTVIGKELNVITLNPKKNFSNIIANKLELVEYKTTSYDNKHNIIIFVASGFNTDISTMNFENVYKQGVESISQSYDESRITYFVIVDKKMENFEFSYFNLVDNRFELIQIPIIVNDDSVTTQSDLKPKDQSRERLKINIAAGVAVVAFIFILYRRKYIYLIMILIPLVYIGYLSIPQKDICIKKGVQIHLLPVLNGTIFETTSSRYTLTKEGSVKGFIKVKLQNEKIGWVRNEDTCSY
ncbi:hypothetical protein GJV85_10055 [Sulfurimonas aquatica]|uniref:SH3 domain-containing protein n=1 Tax=Sulfurimonas aquatica TaxID=2672570 RepID=A0A975B1D4_9BACT|nr:hypothetical protein [Sulfurimonas aquatica]QSZ42436.1 hypothetical protein GJV85_10055 [Sulfurimonas aquatica]